MANTGQSHALDMTKGSPMRLLMQFSLPLFFGNLLQQCYNLADTAIAGHLLGMRRWHRSERRQPYTV